MVLFALSAFHLESARSAIVPITIQHPGSAGLLAARDGGPSPEAVEELLRPAPEIDLLYADDDAPVVQSMLVTVTAKHRMRPYVVVERFEDLLLDVQCASSSGFAVVNASAPFANDTTTTTTATETAESTESWTLSLTFQEARYLEAAERLWSGNAELTFITHHDSCNRDHKQREVYRYFFVPIDRRQHACMPPDRGRDPLTRTIGRSSSIRFDHDRSQAIVVCGRREFDYSTEAHTGFRVRGEVPPPPLARQVHHRILQRGLPAKKRKRSVRTRGYSLDQTWAASETLLNILGQFRITCEHCSSAGEIESTFDVELPELDPANLLPTIQSLVRGEPVKPFVHKAVLTWKVTRPVKQVTNLRTRAEAGVSIRWPGLIKPTSGRKTLGSRIFFDTESPSFFLGGFTFLIWAGCGLIAIGSIGGSIDMTTHARSSVPVGRTATLDLLNPLRSSSDFQPTYKVSTTITSAEGFASLMGAVGAAADLTIKVKIPGMDWAALLDGGGRGPIDFKDGQISWYSGGVVVAPGLSTTVFLPSNLDEKCKPSDTSWAWKLVTEVGYGLIWYSSFAFYFPNKVIPRFTAFPIHNGPPLYQTIPWDTRCFVTGHRRPTPGSTLSAQPDPPTMAQDQPNMGRRVLKPGTPGTPVTSHGRDLAPPLQNWGFDPRYRMQNLRPDDHDWYHPSRRRRLHGSRHSEPLASAA
ncbi:MAG: hypothetical protein M1826_005143 [Phylliscum demangeonii]|nr:MAG: hypothetical protein M1826_005143 [Phylliscum demangeonii]